MEKNKRIGSLRPSERARVTGNVLFSASAYTAASDVETRARGFVPWHCARQPPCGVLTRVRKAGPTEEATCPAWGHWGGFEFRTDARAVLARSGTCSARSTVSLYLNYRGITGALCRRV